MEKQISDSVTPYDYTSIAKMAENDIQTESLCLAI